MGREDESYFQRRPKGDGTGGLITKQEVRAVSLARLQLRADSLVWDIGAGSGSVGLEAARLCHRGHVWAIEKNAHDIEIIRQNHDAFRVANYTLVHDKAPTGMGAWPDPDAVFIGGSGGELARAVPSQARRPSGDELRDAGESGHGAGDAQGRADPRRRYVPARRGRPDESCTQHA